MLKRIFKAYILTLWTRGAELLPVALEGFETLIAGGIGVLFALVWLPLLPFLCAITLIRRRRSIAWSKVDSEFSRVMSGSETEVENKR